MALISRLPTTIDTAGLLSRWRLDGNALDSVGSRNGTWTGNAKYRLDQKLGVNVAEFDGSSYISFSPSGFPSGAEAGTISCLVKCKNTDSTVFFSYGKSEDGYSGRHIRHNTYIFADIHASSTLGSIGSNVSSLSDGTWHSIIVSYNGSTGILYVDGIFNSSISVVATTELSLGRLGRGSYGGGICNGSICDCRVYNVAKSESEVLKIAQFKA